MTNPCLESCSTAPPAWVNEALWVATQVHPLIKESLDECKEVFGGKVALFSNSAGLEQFDPEG